VGKERENGGGVSRDPAPVLLVFENHSPTRRLAKFFKILRGGKRVRGMAALIPLEENTPKLFFGVFWLFIRRSL
jgi:hypothetical protein